MVDVAVAGVYFALCRSVRLRSSWNSLDSLSISGALESSVFRFALSLISGGWIDGKFRDEKNLKRNGREGKGREGKEKVDIY